MKHSPYTLGIITGFCIAALYFMAPGIFESFKQPEPPQPVASKSNFEVVDTYSYENRTCSVIRYTNPSTTWVYLLDCKEVKK
jgi:dTDP-glucose pyrophosphorylase